jgi:two-component system nitrate/nitrite response regulator NarL
MADIRVLIVATDPLARAGLAILVADQAGFHVVGQVGDSEAQQDELDVYRPDVVVWDLGWEPEESLAQLAELAFDSEAGEPGVVALLPDEQQAAAAWSAGARGLLLRDVTPERLQAAISAAAEGLATVEPGLLDSLLPAGPLEDLSVVEELTPRELEVLQLVAEGLANRAIAQRLGISEHTIKFHVNAIMGKLGAQSRTAAVVRATRLGLILL